MALKLQIKAVSPISLNIGFSVQPGEILALAGPSGAGKSTVLRVIAGLVRPDEGHVAVNDTVWLNTADGIFRPAYRRRTGVVFQAYALFPQMTALGNVMAGGANQKRAAELLAMVQLAGLEARKPDALSGGQQQRVALARALARDPDVLLLDEPFSAVDHATREGLYAGIERLRQHLKMPVVLVTHDMEEARRLADRIVMMDNGGKVREGPAEDVFFDPRALRNMGLRDVGSTLTVRVAAQEADGLTRLESATGPLWLPRIEAEPGETVRLRIQAHDVILSVANPDGLSALNAVPGVISAILPGDGPGALVRLAIGPETLISRVTQRSVRRLDLHPGQRCFAVIKSMAVAPYHVG